MISGLFLGSSLLVIMTPGPDVALVTQLVLATGRRGPAVAAALGMLTAGALHATLAVTGVSLILLHDPRAFTAIRWCGAALMLLWGVRAVLTALRAPAAGAAADPSARPDRGTSAGRSYLRGLLCTGTNPKVGLFLLAFLPQFVPPGVAPAPAIALLAGVHLTLAALWLAIVANAMHLLARRVGRRPGAGPALTRAVQGVVGLVFVGFALRLGLQG